MNQQHKSLVAVHTSVLLLGGTSLFSKLIDLPALDITIFRGLVAALILLALIFWRGYPLNLPRGKDYATVIFLGLLLGVHWVTYFHAMKLSTIAIGIISLFTYPVMTVFLAPFFSNKSIKKQDIGSALVVLLGIYLIVPSFDLNNNYTLGIVYGLFSAFLFALRNVVQHHYFKYSISEVTTFYQVLVVSILLTPFMHTSLLNISIDNWYLLMMLGAIFTALPHTLFAYSLIHLSAISVGLIMGLQVVYSTVLAILVLGESPGLLTIMGGILIVSAALFESAQVKRHSQTPRKLV